MTVPALRPLLTTAATALVISSTALVAAPSAFAAPGDNGDIKIHEKGTVEPDPSNDPKVCEFHIAAFNFDGLQDVDWQIFNQPGNNTPVKTGSIVLDQNGDGYTADMSLPDGMYKVEWTWEGQQGAKKSKVFRVECVTPPTTPPTTTPPTSKPPHHKPPHGPVGAGGGGAADPASSTTDGSAFGVGSAIAAGLAGTAGLILIRRSRRRNDGAA
ncbi:hypothetical protein [Streptomyces roseicoloratus]|uniref:Gram-positive cocci surface proteins LPxTG domain-containing protein n=1 Tax=Streptomyces roseicoloratus TaxID=2508722 RepID=A0ABY9S041_9ACTN|nr:hypothetical protein [Streptomyces roseicoloratus]WMX47799.1 hypothetical protein RGF97_27480 [Streptomyces roseicoloratus]